MHRYSRPSYHKFILHVSTCCRQFSLRSVVNQLQRLAVFDDFVRWANCHVDFLRQFVDQQSCINQMHTIALLVREAMKKHYPKDVMGVVTLEALKHCVRSQACFREDTRLMLSQFQCGSSQCNITVP